MVKKYKTQKKENIGHRQGDEITITINNKGYKASGIMNSKGNPIALLYSKGHIDYHQKQAADQFIKYWEILNIGLGMGIDYSRIKVDGSKYYNDLSMNVMDATKQMTEAKQKLGDIGFKLLSKVAGEGIAISNIYTDRKDREAKSYQLRECLDILAVFWGYKTIDCVKKPMNNEKKSYLCKIHPFNS